MGAEQERKKEDGCRTGGESRHHGERDELNERAQVEYRHEAHDDAAAQGGLGGRVDRGGHVGGEGGEVLGHEGAHQERHDGDRPDGQLHARAEEHVRGGRQDGCVQPVDGGQVGELGVGQGLWWMWQWVGVG